MFQIIKKIGDEHRQDLDVLASLEVDYVAEFCKIAISFIINGANRKLFASAAKQLNISREDVERIVTSLSYLFTECAKSNMDGEKLVFTLAADSTKWTDNDPRIDVIRTCYTENLNTLRTLFLKVDTTESCFGISTIPQYKDCEWRLDMECDRRSLMNGNAELKPTYMIHLITNQENKDYYYSMSYNDLKHVTDVLGEALKELKTQHVRRVKNYIY